MGVMEVKGHRGNGRRGRRVVTQGVEGQRSRRVMEMGMGEERG